MANIRYQAKYLNGKWLYYPTFLRIPFSPSNMIYDGRLRKFWTLLTCSKTKDLHTPLKFVIKLMPETLLKHDLVKTATFQGLELFNFIDSKTCFKLSLSESFLILKITPLLFSWFGCPPFVSTAGCASPTVPAPSQTTKSSLGISLTSSENVRRAQEWGICTRNRYKMGPNTSCKWADIGEFLGIERPDILITCIFFFSGYLFLIFQRFVPWSSPWNHHRTKIFVVFYHHRTEDIEAYTLIQRTETWQNPRRIGSQKLTYHLPGGKTIRRIFQFDFCAPGFFCWCHVFVL